MSKLASWIGPIVLVPLAAAAIACGSSTSDTATPDTDAPSDTGLAERWFGRDTKEVTVPAGTVLVVELSETLSSARNQPGDSFSGRIVDPVEMDGEVVIDAGSQVTGRVTEAVRSKKIGGRSRLALEFTSLELPSGEEAPISGSFHGQGKSQSPKDAGTIGGATAGGALLGRIIGHNKGDEDARGTAVGALVGAAIGTGIAASNRGQDVTLPEGTTFQIRLDAPVKVTLDA
jgi:hypothetical protein